MAQFVLSTISIYVMQLNWLSQSVCDHIDIVVRRFVWGSANGADVSLVAWDKIIQPRKQGGLSIRSA